jgi:hypothetical protein
VSAKSTSERRLTGDSAEHLLFGRRTFVGWRTQVAFPTRRSGGTYSFDSRSVITICTMSETVS